MSGTSFTMPIVVGALAVLTAVPAWWPSPPVDLGPLDRSGQTIGEVATVDDVAEVTITEYEADTALVRSIRVRLVEGKWTISSKDNYPADNQGKVGESIGGFLGLTYGRSIDVSGSGDDALAQFGLIDPEKASESEGAGTRVTLATAGGKRLVDMIVGQRVATGSGRYVRLPDEQQVYTADIATLPSAAFTDWVERDLLKVQTSNIASFVVDRHTVRLDDPQPVRMGEIITFDKSGSSWISEQAPEGKSVATDEVTNLLNRLAGLRITNIVPRSDDAQTLQQFGFYQGQLGDGQTRLFGKDGALRITDSLGFTYHCFFGEVAVLNSEAEAELEDPNRYFSIWVTYDQKLDGTMPQPPARPAPAAEDADADVKEAAAQAMEAYGKALADNQTDVQQHLQGRADRMAELNDRFSQYFFVITGDDFVGLTPPVNDLFLIPAPAEANPIAE